MTPSDDDARPLAGARTGERVAAPVGRAGHTDPSRAAAEWPLSLTERRMRHRGPWVLLALLLLGGVAWAQVVTYESITVAGTAVGIGTATLDPPAGGPIRECEWRLET